RAARGRTPVRWGASAAPSCAPSASDRTTPRSLRRVRAADLAAYRTGTAALARPGGIALSVLADSGEAYEAAGLTVRAAPPLLPLRAAALGLILTERHTPAGAPAGIAVTAAYQYDAVGETAAAHLTGQLTALLEAALDTPAAALSRLDGGARPPLAPAGTREHTAPSPARRPAPAAVPVAG
ncbi:hypothetical protein ABZ474_53410, partial [Streptomyces mirabilis]